MSDARTVPTQMLQSFDPKVMLRQAVVRIAGEHHVDLSGVEITPEVQEHWLSLKRQEEHQEAERLAKRRRSLVWQTVGQVIPEHYRGCVPHLAVSDPGKAREMQTLIGKRVYGMAAYRQALDASSRLATGQTRMVTLLGLTGAGKSTLAAIMLRQMAFHWHQHWREGVVDPSDRVHFDGDPIFNRLLCMNRRDEAFSGVFVWTTARDLVAGQKKSAHFSDAFRKAPILVIDDLGGEPTQINLGGVDEILWARHDSSRRVVTILTSGYCNPLRDDMSGFVEPLTARYSEAFTRRLTEPGQCMVIRCPKKETL